MCACLEWEIIVSASNHAALSAFLKRLLLRSRLSTEEQDAVLSLPSHAFQVEARRDVVLPGRIVQDCYLVAEGLVGRFALMQDGTRQITALHIAGDVCDLHSVVAPMTGCGITALSTAVICYVPHVNLRNAAATYPNLAMAFWRDTAVDGSILAKWVANLGGKDARARMAHLLCEMGMRMERAGLGARDCYSFPLSQAQIGEATSLTAVHVNRTLQTLRAEGAVTMHKWTVTIHDWDLLTRIAEFIPTFMLFEEDGRKRVLSEDKAGIAT